MVRSFKNSRCPYLSKNSRCPYLSPIYQDLLNNRPRKALGWYTPREVFSKNVALVT
jgi:hypothetical protein